MAARKRIAQTRVEKREGERERKREGEMRWEGEWIGERGAAASGGARQLTIAKNCHKAKLKTQKQTGKEIATNGAGKPGTDREQCAGRRQSTGDQGREKEGEVESGREDESARNVEQVARSFMAMTTSTPLLTRPSVGDRGSGGRAWL